jgi:DNA-binding response OmpR family regulator
VRPTPRVLVIEDDRDIARLLELELNEAGYEVLVAHSGVSGLITARESSPDLVILDLGLPDLDGIEIARRLNSNGHTPILVLTARDAVESKVALLEAGADDYLVKPFHVQELLARVAVQLRRQQLGAPVTVGDLVIDPVKRRVSCEEREVNLSNREFEMLALLATQVGRIYSRDEIERQLWPREETPSSNAVDVHIGNLRTKLREAGAPRMIRTVRGIGYALRG